MGEHEYQFGLSEAHGEYAYDVNTRRKKGRKILAVVRDYFDDRLSKLNVLDIGCSTGIITAMLAEHFAYTVGIDIDVPALQHAQKTYGCTQLSFAMQDSMSMALPSAHFDLVICSHVYEHVPIAERMMSDIYRVLKPGGVCFFAAGNRLQVGEPHYHLPFLAVVPKPLGHVYMRLAGKGDKYYETHRTLWGLRKLVQAFELIDYTRPIIEHPESFDADDMVRSGSFKHRAAVAMIRYAYWLCPTYIWLLKKRDA